MSDTTHPPAAERRVDVAGQWTLMWWKFRRHKLALWSGVFVLFIYVIALFASFVAPKDPNAYAARYAYVPPMKVAFMDRDSEGNRTFGFHTHGWKVETDPLTLQKNFAPDPDVRIDLRFFAPAPEPYVLWGVLPMNRVLFGPADATQPFYPLGADRLGRDVYSRVIHGSQVSMTVGLVGVGISLVLGIVLGGISGYFGGWVDNIVQRSIEFLKSIPQIPLWMGLAAAIPAYWSPIAVYFMVTVILSLIGWTGLAREVRGRFLALKSEDFVTSARLDGCPELRIILRHMVPSFSSHIIATLTLAVPTMILAETALSFLGIGLRPPVVSWGVLMQEAQNVRTIATAPWLFAPGVAVVVTVLALNFFGDGLRDAADPYA
ncbi:ABC transporter permease [Roseobacter sinensis]|uniref:ABC transporter permease n=1 Tax=Roseobacter sinensis TaxID=2931391 RepID=A0ABT3BG00_9RHOB|nr:ABC transporter permease [Roseobacter sp. WL0113]MCV3272304.1 ABC transporter permease [Roseobacter sp. WL0113]